MKLLKTSRKQNNPIFFQPIQSNSLFDWNLWIYDKIIWFVSIKINQSKTTTTILIMITNQQEPRGKKNGIFLRLNFFFLEEKYIDVIWPVCVCLCMYRGKNQLMMNYPWQWKFFVCFFCFLLSDKKQNLLSLFASL